MEERAEAQKEFSANLIRTILTQEGEMAQRHADAMAAQQDKMMLTFEQMISQTLGQKQGLAGGEAPLGQADEPQESEEARRTFSSALPTISCL